MTLDKQITSNDVQQIADREALVSFFTSIGYSTSPSELKPQHLGISTDSTIKQINRIEKIAADHERSLQVYLFEVKSVTLAITRTIANVFRNMGGNYLLVLTGDYERIDFVLIERSLPSGEQTSQIGVPQAVIRPRIFSINRRKPTRKDLRVLRRFSYTEIDAFAQYDKLLNAYAVLDWSEDFFNNRALFSDYYLLERLRDHRYWKADPVPVYRRFQELYSKLASYWKSKKENDVRKELFEPVFQSLGFHFAENKSPTDSGLKPDYLLYKVESKDKPLTACLVYPWARSLDGKDYTRDADTPDENPGAVVVSLLDSEQFNWIIVTNGKLWRLYSAKAHSRATNYYEIDLEEVIAQADPAESFRYFWLLFRREAFEKDPEIAEERSFLDSLVQGSNDYAKELEERLKERVFDDIFPYFAEGFIAHICAARGCKASELEQAELDKIYLGALTFLYRLLFLLYAESRGLLPVNEYRGYYQKSLTFIKRKVAEVAGECLEVTAHAVKNTYLPDSTAIYDELCELFKIIDRGNKELNVPMYNGGLFLAEVAQDDLSGEAVNARFLNNHKIPDRWLALGLDRLSRDEDAKTFKLVFVDYKSLGVRQLGSIYEGLLEFKLQVADGKMAVVKGKKTEEVIPYQEAVKNDLKIITIGKGKDRQEKTYSKNDVYLTNDKSERKATGSYYTPDYIVKYIVKHAVGPVLEEKFEAVRKSLRKAQQDQDAFRKKQDGLKKAGIKPEPESKVRLIGREVVAELFNIKALDPAMGSGHFLVETVDFITDKMIGFLNAFPNNPVTYYIEETRNTILDEMKKQGISIDAGRLTDLNLLKRHVLKRCIYGVDLNPMAVELAKVSLWLDCFTLGAPLSFLDHHLKCGNSLIGVTVQEVRKEIEGAGWGEKGRDMRAQMGLFGSRFAGLMLATDLMRHVGELSDVTADQVRESRKEYYKASDALAPFKRILDVYASQWFGNETQKPKKGEKKKAAQNPAVEFLKSQHIEKFINAKDISAALKKLPDYERAVAQIALNAAADKRFFHWELEFPEVFYGPREGTQQVVERLDGAGFDAVIGNPPYVRQEGLGDLKIYLAGAFSEVYSGVADIYVYFYGRGHDVARDAGRFGMITSNKFMRSNYGSMLRDFLKTKTDVESIIDFGELPVFSEAATFPCVFIFSKSKPLYKTTFTQVKSLNFENLENVVKKYGLKLGIESFEGNNWSLGSSDETAILRKMEAAGIPLKDYLEQKGTHIRRGVLTGFNEAFVIDRETRDRLIKEDPKSAEIIKPLVVGDDVRRYRINFRERYLILTYIGVPIKEYPAIFKHLKQYQEALETRWDKGKHWWELRACDYYADFEKPKIVYPEIAMEPRFHLDVKRFFPIKTVFSISVDDWFLLTILNSTGGFWYLKQICSVLGDAEKRGRLTLQAIYLERLPIPKIDRKIENSLSSLAKKRTELESKRSYQNSRGKKGNEATPPEINQLDREIDRIVYDLYGLTEAEIAVVEGRKGNGL